MSQGLDELYKIVKDETRGKIILLLSDRVSLSYTELKDALAFTSTGPLNYHLKMLSDLISKNELGQYVLTERGKLAANLLTEFSEKKSRFEVETEFFKLPRWLLTAGAVLSAVLIVGFFGLYLRGVLDFSRFILNSFIVLSGVGVFLVADAIRRARSKWTPKQQMHSNIVWFIAFGALVGACVLMIGGSLLLVAVETFARSAGFEFTLFPFRWWATFCFTGGPVLGGLGGYLFYKRSRYSKKSFYDPYA